MTSENVSARERILATAHDLFYREGIRATGIDRIIKEAGVTKVTFYRHFPAKNDLILAFLQYRHERWISWFRQSLAAQRQQGGSLADGLSATLELWFADEHYRGCAFINTTVELAQALPESLALIRAHKEEMTQALAAHLPDTPHGRQLAQRVALLVDGAIVMAQREGNGNAAVALLREWLALEPLLQAG